jgi:hypothetical protein
MWRWPPKGPLDTPALAALDAEAERLARERGCWQLTLESAHHRTDAHRLYLAFGMEDAGKMFRKPLG